MEDLLIAKIGGELLERPEKLEGFLRAFAARRGRKILVHGGGRSATELAQRLGVETRFIDGRRITSRDMLQVMVMTCGGWLNRHLVATLQAFGCPALGLAGADAGILLARRRPAHPIDFGEVGDLEQVNAAVLGSLLRLGLTPVLAPITHDGHGNLLNTNADTVAAEIAAALAAEFRVRLLLFTGTAGVLRRPQDPDSTIPQLDRETFAALRRAGVITDGMLPKLENGFRALAAGVAEVVVADTQVLAGKSFQSRRATQLIESIQTKSAGGK